MIELEVLKVGNCEPSGPKRFSAQCTTVLLKFEPPLKCAETGEEIKTAIFDIGSAHEIDSLTSLLDQHNLGPGDIDCVFCSHGHSDHVGALGLAPDCLHLIGRDISKRNIYRETAIKPSEMEPGKSLYHFENDENDQASWITTSGHTGHCMSLLLEGNIKVKEKIKKKVILVGDLWDEVGDEDFWRDLSELPEVQEKSRNYVLELKPDLIVPGHGVPFTLEDLKS